MELISKIKEFIKHTIKHFTTFFPSLKDPNYSLFRIKRLDNYMPNLLSQEILYRVLFLKVFFIFTTNNLLPPFLVI